MAGWNQPAKYLSGLPQNDHTQCSAMFPAGLILARPPLVMLPWEEVPSQFPQATWCGSTQTRGHSSLPQGLLHAVRFWGLLRAGIWMMVGPPAPAASCACSILQWAVAVGTATPRFNSQGSENL
jgi:hypothetical protein